MTLTDISKIRLTNQQILKTEFRSIKELAGWMGAIQAQDYAMAKWAIGIRVQNPTDKVVENAIDKGEIIRTHLLRPTWHFVMKEDLRWILELSAPRIKQSLNSRHRELALTDAVFEATNTLIRQALTGGHHLTREELILILKEAKIATGENRASHIFLRAELDGIICSGTVKGKKQTYALLDERIPKKRKFTREEALKKIAEKYYFSRGPATLQDFIWWSGLSVTDGRNALEMIRSGLMREEIDSKIYWFKSPLISENDDSTAYLLPAFDEFIISYKDRTAALSLINHKKAVSMNGIFKPVIIINGKVAGLWKRTVKDKKVTIETELFQSFNNRIKKSIEKCAGTYGSFLEKDTIVKYKTL